MPLFAFIPIIAKFFASSLFAWGVFGAGLLYGFLHKPKNQIGGKLEDFNIIQADYGGAIPIVYGTARTNCQYIWYDFRPEKGFPYEYIQRTSTGGKFYEYHYSINFAVGLCEGEVKTINKIWLNNKLFFDPYSDDPSIVKQSYNMLQEKSLPSEESDHNDERLQCQLIFHYGTDTEPDAFIESIQASLDTPTDVPAFEGLAYIVFKYLQITKEYGNTPPTVSVEYTTAEGTATISTEFTKTTPSVLPINYPQGVVNSHLVSCLNTKEPTKSLSSTGTVWMPWSMGIGSFMYEGEFYTIGRIAYGSYFTSGDYWLGVSRAPDTYTPNYFYFGMKRLFTKDVISSMTFDGSSYVYHGGYVYKIGGDQKVYQWTWPIVDIETNVYKISDDSGIGIRRRPGLISIDSNLYCVGGKVESGGNTNSCFIWNNTTKKFDVVCSDVFAAAGISTGLILDAVLYDNKIRLFYKKDNGLCYFLCSSNGITWEDDTTLGTGYDEIDGTMYSSEYLPSVVFYNGNCYILGGNPFTCYFGKASRFNPEYDVLDMIKDIAYRCGYDTYPSTLVDSIYFTPTTLYGYALTSSSDGKNALSSIQRACAFDLVFHSGKLNVVSRGNTHLVETEIAEDQLGFREGYKYEKNYIKLNKKNIIELPRKVVVSFPDQDREFNTNTQSFSRADVLSSITTEISIPVSMTTTKARKIAEILMLDSYNESFTVSFTLPITYSYLTPTDLLQITEGSEVYNLRLKKVTIQNGVLDCEACIEDTILYSITPNPTVSYPPEVKDTFDYGKCIMLLDIPRIVPIGEKDGNDGYGFYGVACPFTDKDVSWEPLDVLVYNDDKVWEKASSIDKPSVIGYSSGVLNACSTVALMDKKNTVDIIPVWGTLSTYTGVTGTSKNLALLGDEIIQFETVTVVGSTYRLSNLYRGLYGTEWAIGTHASSDRFVLLDNVSYIPLDATKIGEILSYRIGTSRNNNYDQMDFISNCIAKKPLAPVNPKVTLQENGAWKIEWMGRVRGSNTYFIDGIITQDEKQEEYEIDFYDDTEEVKITYTVIVLPKALLGNQIPYLYLYPENRIIDGDMQYGQRSIQYPLQSSLKFKIYQIGSVGRGYPLSYNI